MVHCCMHWCAICQEHREMKGRLAEIETSANNIVNPPPVQQMSANENNPGVASPAASQNMHPNVEMQTL